MFNLIKYEFRKHFMVLVILAGMLVFIEGFTLYSIFMGSRSDIFLAFSMIVGGCFAAILMIFTLGIQAYSRELGSRNSYMMFMTPNSTYRIVGAKLIFTLIVALATTAVSCMMLALDWNLLTGYSQTGYMVQNLIVWIRNIFEDGLHMDLNQFLMSFSVTLILLWLSVFTFICIAYFSITLSATAFSNRKGRGALSFVIFVALCIVLAKCSDILPDVYIGSGYIQDLCEPLLSYVLDIGAMIAALIGTGLLLDKKISL